MLQRRGPTLSRSRPQTHSTAASQQNSARTANSKLPWSDLSVPPAIAPFPDPTTALDYVCTRPLPPPRHESRLCSTERYWPLLEWCARALLQRHPTRAQCCPRSKRRRLSSRAATLERRPIPYVRATFVRTYQCFHPKSVTSKLITNQDKQEGDDGNLLSAFCHSCQTLASQ